ncbi:hypothetical protein H1C71_028001 [Ictidomys tridecemlineatus]|nr:hypothetical protein H1C71_028001 [Ictidomys tridecemlineatus]
MAVSSGLLATWSPRTKNQNLFPRNEHSSSDNILFPVQTAPQVQAAKHPRARVSGLSEYLSLTSGHPLCRVVWSVLPGAPSPNSPGSEPYTWKRKQTLSFHGEAQVVRPPSRTGGGSCPGHPWRNS